MRKCLLSLACFAAVFALPAVLRMNAAALLAWQAGASGRAVMAVLNYFPYACMILSALWASRIANTPVYVLSLTLIPAQYYFSGGAPFLGGGDQMRFVLFLLLPLLVTSASFVSHRTLACTAKCGLAVLALGFLLPPVMSAVFGRHILTWIGAHRWSGAGFLGVPSSATIYYIAVFALNLLLPFGGREGQMKKMLSALIPCFYFSGVFRPIYRFGPLYPPGLEETAFVICTSASAALLLHANFLLSWSKAYVDDLTQVLGRRALNEAMAHLEGEYAIAMVDIDHFKKFNDTYGHAAGDMVLREVAAILSEESGGEVYRYGGEEFSVFFRNTPSDEAVEQMDAVRQVLAETKIPLNGSAKREKKVTVHISVGVAERTNHHNSPEDVIHSADKALYKAKESGRNRVVRA